MLRHDVQLVLPQLRQQVLGQDEGVDVGGVEVKAIALTGITDQMLRGAPKEEQALRDFLAFVGDRPLAAVVDEVALHTVEDLDVLGGVPRVGEALYHAMVRNGDSRVAPAPFDMTDFKTSVRVTKYLEKEEKAKLRRDVKPGMWVKVQGYVKLNRDGSDILLDPKSISTYPHEMRQDRAEVKRVELHAHTTFSNMDALSGPSPPFPGIWLPGEMS